MSAPPPDHPPPPPNESEQERRQVLDDVIDLILTLNGRQPSNKKVLKILARLQPKGPWQSTLDHQAREAADQLAAQGKRR